MATHTHMQGSRLIRILILSLFTVFPFGQLTRISLLPSVNLYLHDLLIIVLILVWAVNRTLKRQPFPRPPLLFQLVLFSLVAGISLVFNLSRVDFSELMISGLYLARWIGYSGLYIIVNDQVRLSRIRQTTILNGLMYAGIVSAVLGIIQYFLYPNLINLVYLGWDPHEYRIFGTFFDSGYMGILLVLTIILITGHVYSASKHIRLHQFFSLPHYYNWALGVVYMALALTYSRSSYVALLATASIVSLVKRSVKPFAMVVLILIITILVLPRPSPISEGVKLERTSTVTARMNNYAQAFDVISRYPMFGVGFNTLRYYKRDNAMVPEYEWQENHAAAGLDNSFLFVWATTGIIGLLAYVYLWFSVLRLILRKYAHKDTKKVSLMALSAFGAIIVHSLFLNTLFYPWIMIWTWMLLGCMVEVKRRL